MSFQTHKTFSFKTQIKIFKGYVRDWNLSDWEAKRSTSALPNRSQIWDTVWRFNIHSPGLSFCLDRKSAARFSIPGTWIALKERNLSWDQRRRWRASLSRVRDREPPWRFMWDTTAILSVLTMIWYPPRTRRKYFKCQEDSPEFQAVYMPREELFLPLPARRSAFEDCAPACHWCVRRDHMAAVDRTHSHPAPEKNGVSPH